MNKEVLPLNTLHETGCLRSRFAASKRVWMKHGALDYEECMGDDLKTHCGMTFTQLMKLKPGETVIFAYIVFKSKAHRDSVNTKVIKEMEKISDMPKKMPFDMKRMVYGGFKGVVES